VTSPRSSFAAVATVTFVLAVATVASGPAQSTKPLPAITVSAFNPPSLGA
jgi:hypothetical protein